MRRLIFFAIAVLFYQTGYAVIINIPDDYSSIQDGIYYSSDGDTVLVDSGTYHENLELYEKDIVLASMFYLTGDSSYIHSTIIDGSADGSVITIYNAGGQYLNVSGFTITNGFTEQGGGIYCYNANPVISNNIIKENVAIVNEGASGGGIYLSYSEAVIVNNVIEINYVDGALSPEGGGIYGTNSSPLIRGNIIRDNMAGKGGGLYFENCNPTLENNLIVSNNGLFGGGGIYADGSVVLIINCTFSGNEADWYMGGAIYFEGNYLTVNNSILYYNIALLDDPEIHLSEGIAEITCTDITGDWDGEGNLDMHPYFRDLENDFHLMAIECGDSDNSPLIDMGSPDILDELLDCEHGLGTLISDMGVYGGGDSVSLGFDISGDILPDKVRLFQNYPNPFNARTNIEFMLAEPQHVRLDIFDILGRKMGTLVDEIKQAGHYTVSWQADNYASGVYFSRLTARDYTNCIRLVLIK